MSDEIDTSTWRENRGKCPISAKGKRVAVLLRNGMVEGLTPVSTGCPAGWPADDIAAGRGRPARWTLLGHDFDIVRYKVHGE